MIQTNDGRVVPVDDAEEICFAEPLTTLFVNA